MADPPEKLTMAVDDEVQSPTKEYQCKYCDVKMSTHYKLNSHMRVHKDVTMRNTSLASGQYVKKKMYSIVIKNGAKTYKCNICKKEMTTHFQLNSHMRTHKLQKNAVLASTTINAEGPMIAAPRNRYDCRLCDKKMTNHYQLNIHMQIHKDRKKLLGPFPFKIRPKIRQVGVGGSRKRYKCKYCTVKMSNHYQLNSHMRVHKVKTDSIDLPPPPDVAQVLPEEETLTSRNQSRKDYHSLHHGAPFKISNRRSMSTESRASSTPSVETSKSDPAKLKTMSPEKMEHGKVFKCKICGEIMRNQNHLNWHMRVHKDLKETQDGVQVKQGRVTSDTFSSPFQLHAFEIPLSQKLVHDGPLIFRRNFSPKKIVKVKPFQCTKCRYSAMVRQYLALHIRLVHEGVTPQKCKFCWISFPTLEKLEEHVSLNHDNVPNGLGEIHGEGEAENGVVS